MAELVLLSVRPRFAARLIDGTKTVEIRRRPTRLAIGDVALVYSSSPTRAIVGAVRISGVATRAPSTVWRRFGPRTALSKAEFDAYVAGSATATAIEVDGFRALLSPVDLSALRTRSAGFVVPQSYRFVQPMEARRLLNGERTVVNELMSGRETFVR
jgi:predicted transcriptional regulator